MFTVCNIIAITETYNVNICTYIQPIVHGLLMKYVHTCYTEVQKLNLTQQSNIYKSNTCQSEQVHEELLSPLCSF